MNEIDLPISVDQSGPPPKKKCFFWGVHLTFPFDVIQEFQTEICPIALYRRLGRSLFFGRRLVDSIVSTRRLDSPTNFFYIYDLL